MAPFIVIHNKELKDLLKQQELNSLTKQIIPELEEIDASETCVLPPCVVKE